LSLFFTNITRENQKNVYGIYKLVEDGKRIIVTCPITEKELQVYRQYPDTFFGVHKKQSQIAKDPLDLFDFFYNSYKNTPKEKLLEFLKVHPLLEELKNETQQELAITYCESLVYSAMRSH